MRYLHSPGILAGDSDGKSELSPCGKMLAAAVPGGLFRHFVDTISGYELEKLLKDAIVAY